MLAFYQELSSKVFISIIIEKGKLFYINLKCDLEYGSYYTQIIL